MALDWMRAVHGAGGAALPSFRPGDRIRVWYRISEQGKERLGQFEGDVIRARGSGPSRTFTVRRVTYGEGVERVFPVDSKAIARVEVLQPGKVRRSRLYYLRRVVGKTRIAAAGTGATDLPGAPAAGTGSTHAEAGIGPADSPGPVRSADRAPATP
jgi:large subunit ribosomal protein L19